ncbi:GNAT family N-acetyltransferase [Streptomyces sp. RKAG290]|uniref:GNAT family N-acetyltransferase n=1 Tax=Streptomyces sp. RKAG290 TaxID=2888348 RepID=UPI002033340A|nr:GNAT family N-acetyltransferase [Streptomyces sp. RKAG290]MCM2410471.1 GNAT family N-acetyltransferase [Streptomyces sp. RKAG290]
MPYLVPPLIPQGRLASSAQPLLPVAGDLLLRPWQPTDAPAVVAAFTDPAIQRWHVRRADSVDEARGWIAQWQGAWSAESAAHWAVVRPGTGADAAGDNVLGRVSLRSMNLGMGLAECAYWVLPAARGTGVAARAVDAVSRWAFETIGFERLELAHSVANEASCRVAHRCGFVLEGTRRRGHLHTDGWHDMHVHARVRADDAEG